MKNSCKSICFFLMITGISLFHNKSIAQTRPVLNNITGAVIDSVTQQPVEFATITLKDADQKILRTAVAKADGSFAFERIPAAAYYIVMVNLGYAPKSLTADISAGSRDLGKIEIVPQSSQLAAVSVTANRPIVKQEIDRLVYNVQADPESRGSTVMEMMRKVPLLSVDGDDNILLKGNSSYKILVNGKPSSMMERNAKDILKSMPASSIKNIEVIYNPSSKYDAEGVAGLINIITNKSTFNGYNGSLSLSHRFPVGGPGSGGTFSLRQGKFGVSFVGGGNFSNSPLTNSLNKRITTGDNAYELSQSNTKESDTRSGYIGPDFSYEIDSLNLISAQFNINGNKSDGTGNLNSRLNGLADYNLNSNYTGKGHGLDAALNYQLGFRSDKSRLLTFSYYYLGFGNDEFNSIDISNSADYNQTNEGSYDEHTFQIDYVHPVKRLNIEAGLKSILRINKSDFQYKTFNPASGGFEPDAAMSNQYKNHQDVYSAYNTYTYNLNNWGFRAGIRVEQTIIDANFISNATHVRQNYINIIPAVSISRKFKDRSSIVLNYTNRMQRPGIYQLNPFTDRSNPDFESSGNPNLKPTFTNIIQMSYNSSKKASVSITAAYMFFNSFIGPVSAYDPALNITRTSFANAGTGKILRSNFYLSYPLTKKLNVTLNTDIRYAWMTALINNQTVSNNRFMQYINVSGAYRLESGWRFNANFTANTPAISGAQGRTNAFTASSFGLSKEIVKDKFGLTAGTSNPFTKYRRNNDTTLGPDFTQTRITESYYRAFSLGLNYRFGKLKEGIKKTQRKIVNDDVVNEK